MRSVCIRVCVCVVWMCVCVRSFFLLLRVALRYRICIYRTGETHTISFLGFHWWRPLLRIYAPIPSMKLTKPYRQSFKAGRPSCRQNALWRDGAMKCLTVCIYRHLGPLLPPRCHASWNLLQLLRLPGLRVPAMVKRRKFSKNWSACATASRCQKRAQ